MSWKPRDIWERGIPLQSAWPALASDDERAKAEAIESAQEIITNPEVSSLSELLTGVFKAFSDLNDTSRARRDLRAEFEYRILCDLFNEELYGFGFPIHPATIRTPRRIDPTFWDNPDIDWDEGEARIEQNTYNRIRLVDPYKFPDIALGPKSPGPKPVARQQICWAIDHLSKTDKDFWKLTDHIRIFRLHGVIKSNFGIDTKAERGFSEKNFQKYLLEFKKRNIKN